MKQVSFHKGGFTLVELLVVMVIIATLAGLTLSTIQFVVNEGKRKRAVAEITTLGLAIGAYKADYGDYPRDANYTDMLDARSDPDARIPPPTSSPYLMPASVALYKALSGDSDASGTIDASEKANTIYFHFPLNMLHSDNGIITAVVDPFRNAYGYSTIGSSPAATGAQGYNPTYDLWSTADPEKKGPRKNGTPPVSDFTNLWITNFR